MNRFTLLTFFALSAAVTPASAWTNDLRITSIVRTEDCTTLTWRSHPGEFYTVFWSDELQGLNTFWRVAEVNVPSGGTNTTWTEGACSESMMAVGGGNTTQTTLTKEQIEAFMEKMKGYEVPDYVYPPGHPKAPKERPASTTQGGGTMSLLGGGPTNGAIRFYHVTRTAVEGFVDSWGLVSTNLPAGLTNIIGVSAGSRGSTLHNLALRADGTVTAWGDNNYG